MILAHRILPFPGVRPEHPGFATALPGGRLTELSGVAGSARTSLAFAAVRAAQAEGETAAWIQTAGGPFYPPDAAECGVDLATLVVVQVPAGAADGKRAGGRHGEAGAFRAAEILLRSGAFGLVTVDLRGAVRATGGMQSRLAALAREHGSRVLLITERSATAESLGPLVSLRVEPHRTALGGGRFAIDPVVLKCKQGGPLELATERRRAPWSPR